MKIPAGTAVAVLGDRKLGLLVAQALQAHGAAAVAPLQVYRLSFAASRA